MELIVGRTAKKKLKENVQKIRTTTSTVVVEALAIAMAGNTGKEGMDPYNMYFMIM